MAKIATYKFVNPGMSKSKSPTVQAANLSTLGINRIGATVESMGSTVLDLSRVRKALDKEEVKEDTNAKKQARLEKDAAAEDAEQVKKIQQGKVKKKPKIKDKKKVSWIENFLGPFGSFLVELGAFALTTELLKYLSDEENVGKIETFITKAKFVFDKLKEFADNITSAISSALDFIFGKETTIEERFEAFGKIIAAITGITGLLMAAQGALAVRDALQTTEDVADAADAAKRVKPRTNYPDELQPDPKTGPDGKPYAGTSDPDLRGPRGRVTAAEVGDRFGDAAEKQYRKILKEYGDDAARAFENALENSGGNVSKAQKAFKRLNLSPLQAPPPSAGKRLLNWLGARVDDGKKLGSAAIDMIGKGLKALPAWAGDQWNNLSKAGKTAWNNTVTASEALVTKGKKFASAAADKFTAGIDFIGNKAKSFFLEKVVAPLKPIFQPILDKAADAGKALQAGLQKIPGYGKVAEVFKSKGITNIATAGKKLGKRAAAVLPVIGGLVNLVFAYDRAANGDSIGALIEGTSGILDLAGVVTGGTTNIASMFLDGYMFARDFIPQLQDGENQLITSLGLMPFKMEIDKVLDKLPNLGEIINFITGNAENTANPVGGQPPDQETPELAAGGEVKVINVSHSNTGSGYGIEGLTDYKGRPAVFSKAAAEKFGQMMKDSKGVVKGVDIHSSQRSKSYNRKVGGVANSNHLFGNALDIHGSSQTWMRRHGPKYGWIINDYPGSHGGHFNYKGAGASKVNQPDEGSIEAPSPTPGQGQYTVAGITYDTATGRPVSGPGIDSSQQPGETPQPKKLISSGLFGKDLAPIQPRVDPISGPAGTPIPTTPMIPSIPGLKRSPASVLDLAAKVTSSPVSTAAEVAGIKLPAPVGNALDLAAKVGLGGEMFSAGQFVLDAAMPMFSMPLTERSDMFKEGGFSENFALNEGMKTEQVPIVITQLTTIPQIIPINSPAPPVISGGPSSLLSRLSE